MLSPAAWALASDRKLFSRFWSRHVRQEWQSSRRRETRAVPYSSPPIAQVSFPFRLSACKDVVPRTLGTHAPLNPARFWSTDSFLRTSRVADPRSKCALRGLRLSVALLVGDTRPGTAARLPLLALRVQPG